MENPMIHIRVPIETRKQLKIASVTNGVSISQFVNEIIDSFFEKQKEKSVS